MMPYHACRRITLSFLLSLVSRVAYTHIIECGDESKRSLVFKPDQLVLNRKTPSVSLTITCQHVQIPNLTRKLLTLNRTSDTSMTPKRLLVWDTEQVRDMKVVKNAVVARSVENGVSITLPEASCSDTKMTYTCETADTFSSTTIFCLYSRRLQAMSKPIDVEMTVDPQTDAYNVGDIMNLTCSATVGLKGENSDAEWVWEEKELGKGWTNFRKYVTIPDMEILNSCLKVRRTTLKINLHSIHNGREYRCFVVKGGNAFLEAAVSYTVKVNSFMFGLKTMHGAMVLAIIVIILFTFLTAIVVGVRYNMLVQASLDRNMYQARVMTRLDMLFRFEAELIGDIMKMKKHSEPKMPEKSPEESPPTTPPKQKKRFKKKDVDPREIIMKMYVIKPTPSPKEQETEEEDS